MPTAENYARRAISQTAHSAIERHHNLAQHADACLSFPEMPNYRDS